MLLRFKRLGKLLRIDSPRLSVCRLTLRCGGRCSDELVNTSACVVQQQPLRSSAQARAPAELVSRLGLYTHMDLWAPIDAGRWCDTACLRGG